MLKGKTYIPNWLLLILVIIALASLVIYFKISSYPRIEDLFINLSATVLGILITLFIVDRIIKYYERKEWKEFEQIINSQIVDSLFSLCNFMNLHSSIWKQWLEIFKNDSEKKQKVRDYLNVFQSTSIDFSYAKEIIKDDHLIDFFDSGYKSSYQKLDEVFRLFNNKLTAEQSTQILHLRMNLSSLISNLSTFRTLNFINQEYKLPPNNSHIQDFFDNARKTIHTMKALIEIL